MSESPTTIVRHHSGNGNQPKSADFNAVKRAIRERISCETVLGDAGISHRGNRWACPNPEHSGQERGPDLKTFTGDDGLSAWNCHACGAGGDVFDLAIHIGIAHDFSKAFGALAARAGVDLPSTNTKPARKKRAGENQDPPLPTTNFEMSADLADAVKNVSPKRVAEIRTVAVNYWGRQLWPDCSAASYLVARRITLEAARAARVGWIPAENGLERWAIAELADADEAELLAAKVLNWSPQTGRLYFYPERHRLPIPAYDFDGATVLSFSLRRCDDKAATGPKELGASPRVLFGLEQLGDRAPRPEFVLLAEGTTDYLTGRTAGMVTIGVPGASSWKLATEKRILDRIPADVPIVICFDADATGRKHSAKLATALRESGRRILHIEPANDGADLNDCFGADDGDLAGAVRAMLDGADAAGSLRVMQTNEPPSGPPPTNAAPAQSDEHPNESAEEPDDPHRLGRLHLRIHAHHADGLTLRWWREDFFWWNGAAWVARKSEDVKASLTATVKNEFDRVQREEFEEWQDSNPETRPRKPPATRKVTRTAVGNAMGALQSMALLEAIPQNEPPIWIGAPKPQASDWKPWEIIAAKNGLVHLPSVGTTNPCLISPTPAFFTLNGLEFDFSPDAPAPVEWLKFLGQLWPDDGESIELLQEWFGYCLTADTSQQKILLMLGPKRSGKGTIAGVLSQIIGVHNVASPTLSGLATNFGLEPLIGKSAAIIGDARLSGRPDLAVVAERLLSISGGDLQTIDRKHKSHITTRLPVRFLILTNELPRLTDSSGALASRFLILRLAKSWIGQEDRGLAEKLAAELPGILLWAIAGWRRLCKRGRFVQPGSASEFVQQMEELSSPISAFIREQCVIQAGAQISKDELFDAWKNWCNAANRHATDKATFSRDLLAAIPGVRSARLRTESGRRHAYQGIRLKSNFETDDSGECMVRGGQGDQPLHTMGEKNDDENSNSDIAPRVYSTQCAVTLTTPDHHDRLPTVADLAELLRMSRADADAYVADSPDAVALLREARTRRNLARAEARDCGKPDPDPEPIAAETLRWWHKKGPNSNDGGETR